MSYPIPLVRILYSQKVFAARETVSWQELYQAGYDLPFYAKRKVREMLAREAATFPAINERDTEQGREYSSEVYILSIEELKGLLYQAYQEGGYALGSR